VAQISYATVLQITIELRTGISMRTEVIPGAEHGLRELSRAMVDWPQTVVDWPQTVCASDLGAAIGRLDAAAGSAVGNRFRNLRAAYRIAPHRGRCALMIATLHATA
jgi:hypothetical protein